MAIRLRKVEGHWVALCAVESDPKPNDIYLDDGQHHALAEKFAEDFRSMGFYNGPVDDVTARFAKTQRMRDARVVAEAVCAGESWEEAYKIGEAAIAEASPRDQKTAFRLCLLIKPDVEVVGEGTGKCRCWF